MAEHKPQPTDHYKLETMMTLAEKWETDHLDKIPILEANHEIGQFQEAVRAIATRVGKKMQAERRNKCAACMKPLNELRGPFNTIPIYDINTSNYVNQYACSAKCSEKLQEKARDAQTYLATH